MVMEWAWHGTGPSGRTRKQWESGKKEVLTGGRVKEAKQNRMLLKGGSERAPLANFTCSLYLLYYIPRGHLQAPIRK